MAVSTGSTNGKGVPDCSTHAPLIELVEIAGDQREDPYLAACSTFGGWRPASGE